MRTLVLVSWRGLQGIPLIEEIPANLQGNLHNGKKNLTGNNLCLLYSVQNAYSSALSGQIGWCWYSCISPVKSFTVILTKT